MVNNQKHDTFLVIDILMTIFSDFWTFGVSYKFCTCILVPW